MRAIKRMLCLVACGLFTFISSPTLAQDYPDKQVRLIVPYPVGTSNEVFARFVAQHLSVKWGVPVVVDAIPGAGGVVGSQVLASSKPDGYTLGWVSSPHAINAAVYRDLPYDSIKSFQAIVNLVSTPMVFVVSTSSPVTSIDALISQAKSEPKKLNYGSNGNGSSSHLATELLANSSGASFTHIPYKSTSQITMDLIAGRIDFAALGLATVLPLINNGTLQALAVTSAERAVAMPDTPSVSESVDGYETKAWMGLLAPAGVPAGIVDQVSADAMTVLQRPDVVKAMTTQGLSTDTLDSKAFAQRIENDVDMWKRVVHEANIHID